jgi:hypothetical protein
VRGLKRDLAERSFQMEILRTSYYAVGLIREPGYEVYDEPGHRWDEEFNNRDNWEFSSSRSGAAEALQLRWLADERRNRLARWLTFIERCNKKGKLLEAVSTLNRRYHAYRRLCEKRNDWRWVYLTASQYRVLRTLIWEKVS